MQILDPNFPVPNYTSARAKFRINFRSVREPGAGRGRKSRKTKRRETRVGSSAAAPAALNINDCARAARETPQVLLAIHSREKVDGANPGLQRGQKAPANLSNNCNRARPEHRAPDANFRPRKESQTSRARGWPHARGVSRAPSPRHNSVTRAAFVPIGDI